MIPPLISLHGLLVLAFLRRIQRSAPPSNHCKSTQVSLYIGFLILFLCPFLYAKHFFVGILHNY